MINKKILNFPFPPRWHYDIVKALDCFRERQASFDERMVPALEEIRKKKGRLPDDAVQVSRPNTLDHGKTRRAQ